MNGSFFVALSVAAGACVALQGLVNSALRLKAGFALTVFINACVGLVAAFAVLIASRTSEGQKPPISWNEISWPLYLGGGIGILIILLTIIVYPKLGATWALMLMIFGQLSIAMLADHFGWFGIPRTPIAGTRILGAILVLSGCFLARKS